MRKILNILTIVIAEYQRETNLDFSFCCVSVMMWPLAVCHMHVILPLGV